MQERGRSGRNAALCSGLKPCVKAISAAGRPNLWGAVPDVVEMQSEAGAAGGPGGGAGGGGGAAGGGGEAKGGEEKIVDAEYTEVKDRK